MRKGFLALVLAAITGVSLFAWEPQDLTKFPHGQDAKSLILNLGVGLPTYVKQHEEFIGIPPMRLSIDKNIEGGDKKLPFFIGGIFGYQGYGYTVRDWLNNKKKYFYHDISLGLRFGYHFNWGVDNLDTYAVATGGWIIYTGTERDVLGWPLAGVNIGARYFISKGFGFWVEAGYTSFSWLDIGLAFKF